MRYSEVAIACTRGQSDQQYCMREEEKWPSSLMTAERVCDTLEPRPCHNPQPCQCARVAHFKTAAPAGVYGDRRGGPHGPVTRGVQSAHPRTQMPRGAFSSRGATRTLPAPLPPSVALPVRRCPTQYSRVKSSPSALALVAAADGSGSGHGRVKVGMAVQLVHWQASRPSPIASARSRLPGPWRALLIN